jgi:CheY-like chemotaxis protein
MSDIDAGLRILHVEDDANDAFLVGHAFKKEAPQVRVAVVTDGREAQEYLAGKGRHEGKAAPDLVLMDLKLPRMTGLEVLEWMKSREELRRLPVFILSSSSEKSDVERANALGVNGYFSKQGTIQGLVEVVRALIAFAGKKSGREENHE